MLDFVQNSSDSDISDTSSSDGSSFTDDSSETSSENESESGSETDSSSTSDSNVSAGHSTTQTKKTRRKNHTKRPKTGLRKPATAAKPAAKKRKLGHSTTKTQKFKSYGDKDVGRPKHRKFHHAESCGPRLPAVSRLGIMAFTKALDFFKLFFTLEILELICNFTNKYAAIHKEEKPSYNWTDVTPDEMYRFIGLVIFMGVIRISNVQNYWAKGIYDLYLPRVTMSFKRFKSICAFLHIVDPENEGNKNDRLRKVSFLVDKFKKICQDLYIPSQFVSVDERMVKSKGRSGIRQYIKNKTVKFGIKVWVLAESSTGYTIDFDIYSGGKGKNGNKETKTKERGKGLGYQVVMELCKSLQNDGYQVFFDNFFTTGPLLDDLLEKGILACGTSQKGRVGYPLEFKGTETSWNKTAKRGDMRWYRDGNKLVVQWKDKRLVTIMSTIHDANKFDMVKRKVKKKGGGWDENDAVIKRPYAFKDYNQNMGGVDLSDQLIGKYNVLRKVDRWWKTIFYHLIDIACVNSYIMLQSCRQKYGICALKRKKTFGQLEFREELIGQLTGALDAFDDQIEEEGSEDECIGQHKYILSVRQSRNCGWCYHIERLPTGRGKERKVTTFCATCEKHFCHTKLRDCMAKAHHKDNVNILNVILTKRKDK